MRGIVVITQNEVGRLPSGSDKTLASLLVAIVVVLQGPQGTTLVHMDAHTDPQFLVDELGRLGPESTIKLFKNSRAPGDLTNKIIRHLIINSIKIEDDLITSVTPVSPLPYGIIIVTTKKSGQPAREICMKIASGGATSGESDNIDFGPQDHQMRTYKQQMFGYLNPDVDRYPTVIYDNDTWQDAFELNCNDANLLKFLFGIKSDKPMPEKLDPIKLRKKVIKMLASSSSDIYIEKFANEYKKYKLGSPHGLYVYNVQFPELLERAYAYMLKKGLSFDEPTPKTGSIPLLKPAARPS
jgi:hypothetical protein